MVGSELVPSYYPVIAITIISVHGEEDCKIKSYQKLKFKKCKITVYFRFLIALLSL